MVVLRLPLTLRTRLIVALLVFSAAGLTAFAVASVLLLRESLLARVDDQLRDMAMRTTHSAPPPDLLPGGDSRVHLPSDFRLIFLDPQGDVRFEISQPNGQADGPQLPQLNAAAVRNQAGRPFTAPDQRGGSTWRVRTTLLPDGSTAAVALSLVSLDATVGRLLGIEAAVGGGVLVLVGVVATMVVRLGLRPLTRIEHTAQAIAAGELNRRVPDAHPDTETGRLGGALNTMLGRLAAALRERENSQQRLRAFVADASHELRTPLTSIRGFAELYRRGGAPDAAGVQRLMSRIEDEATRMSRLVDDLLLLARLDEERALDITDVDLVMLAADTVHDAHARDPDRPVTLEAPHGPVRVLGDEHRLRQVISNLVANALVHTPGGTPVRLRVTHQPATTRNGWRPVAVAGAPEVLIGDVGMLEVHDDGPGIPVAEAPHLFDRFYRAGQARAQRRTGSGLGLAITAAILEAHRGRVELSSTPGQGTTFRAVLPLA